MNCDQAMSHLTELARREPIDSVRQAECQAHLGACTNCRQRLAEIESLQRTLRLAAEADRRQEASPVVEQRLLAALRAARVDAGARPGRALWRSSALWRVAAVLLLVIGLALTEKGSQRRPIETRTRSTVAKSASAPVTLTPPIASTGVTDADASTRRRSKLVPKPDLSLRPGRPGRVLPTADSRATAVPVAPDDEMEEALTDYLLLSPGHRLYPLERGQLIRVTVPRSTLGSFGFPVNPERAMMPVKADLVVGEDGLTRAIRFIK